MMTSLHQICLSHSIDLVLFLPFLLRRLFLAIPWTQVLSQTNNADCVVFSETSFYACTLYVPLMISSGDNTLLDGLASIARRAIRIPQAQISAQIIHYFIFLYAIICTKSTVSADHSSFHVIDLDSHNNDGDRLSSLDHDHRHVTISSWIATLPSERISATEINHLQVRMCFDRID